jgi:TPR repeat protein
LNGGFGSTPALRGCHTIDRFCDAGDLSAAARYYGDAAVAGHPDGQYRLAEAFANGLGVERDLSWAMRWYGKAAYQGHPKAQFACGVLFGTRLSLNFDRRRRQ